MKMKYQIRILSNKEGAIMGLLNKLKDVLFEVEEVEIPAEEEEKVVTKKAVVPNKELGKRKDAVKMTFDGEDDIVSDRELFKAEPTFNFPVFDEKEFEVVKKEEPKPPLELEATKEIKTRVMNRNTNYDTYEPIERRTKVLPKEPIKKEVSRDYDYKEIRKSKEVTRNETRKFTPSPVISPVYGVLDKNYKKEDIVLRNDDVKTIDVDSVRKKAFGTLEEDIEKTLSTSASGFYEQTRESRKSLDDFLVESAEEVIPVSKKEEPIMDLPSFNIEEPVKLKEEKLEVIEEAPKRSFEEKLEDETLENDLFDLIDSMYETREDGEIS